MKAIYLMFISMLIAINAWGQDLEFGKITISPYIPAESGVEGTAAKLLETKLKRIVTASDATGGFDRRFIIVPELNILSENTTASIPQKTSLKASFTFFIGDGVSGSLFGSTDMEVTGIGDSHASALYSAIRKISVNDKDLQGLIAVCKQRIVKYYNNVAPALIKEAEKCMAGMDYETALSKLAVIPALCKDYDKAQKLIILCGKKILEKNNAELLMAAQAAWNASPDREGAKKASEYISQMTISSQSMKDEVNRLNNQMRQRLIQLDDQEMELRQAQIASEENIRIEEIRASANVTSTIWSSLPNLVYSIFSWF